MIMPTKPLDLRELRESLGMPIVDVGGNPNHYLEVERGHVRIGVQLIRRLSKVFGCSTKVVAAACRESWERGQAEARTPAK